MNPCRTCAHWHYAGGLGQCLRWQCLTDGDEQHDCWEAVSPEPSRKPNEPMTR